MIPVKTKSSVYKPPPEGDFPIACEPRYGSSDDEDDVDPIAQTIETVS